MTEHNAASVPDAGLISTGLRLRFFRDLAYQFNPNSSNAHPADPSVITDAWITLGSLDYVKVSRLESLQALARAPELPRVARLNRRFISGSNELLLFPINDSIHSRLATSSEHASMASELCDTPPPLFALVRLSLASAAYDLPVSPTGGTELLKAASAIIARLVKRDGRFSGLREMTSWATLGGPDLACLVIPRTADDLKLLTTFVHVLRGTTLKSLFENVSIPLKEEPPHTHAFAAVQATLSFRQSEALNTLIQSDDFRKAEIDTKLRYPCRMTVDPGHETTLANHLDTLFNSRGTEKYIAITWGFRSLVAEFRHLSDLIKAVEFFSNAVASKSAPVVSACRSTIGCEHGDWESEAGKGPEHQELSLSAELLERLKYIADSFDAFSAWLSTGMLGYRLHQAYSTIEAALCRNDRAIAVRDLLPFVDQLARCFKELQYWEIYVSSSHGTQANDLVGEFSTLLGHLWQALRNRVEQRGEPLDPTFPNTLEYGASKLVNAYTVAAWVASELITRVPANRARSSDSSCGSQYFGACVSVSIEGRVWCEESFADVRRIIHRSEETHLASRADEKWNFPLLLLTISGPTLFQPELTFVHCLHEMAEFSRWFELPSATKIHTAVWDFADKIFSELVGLLVIRQCADGQAPELKDAALCISYLWKLGLTPKENKALTMTDVEKAVEREIRGRSPRSIFSVIWRGLTAARIADDMCFFSEELVDDPTYSISRPIPKAVMPSDWFGVLRNLRTNCQVSTCRETGREIDLHLFMNDLGSLINEVVADTVMITALKYLLCPRQSDCPAGEFEEDLTRVFVSIVASAVAYLPNTAKVRAVDTIISRWQVQHVIHVEKAAGGLKHFEHSLRMAEPRLQKVLPSFSVNEWKQRQLERSQEITGNRGWDILGEMAAALHRAVHTLRFAEVFFQPGVDGVCDEIVSAFVSLWVRSRDESPDGACDAERLAFIHLLWIKGTRFFAAELFARRDSTSASTSA